MTDLPDHDNDEDLGAREDFWAHLATRFDDKNYLTAREHFDMHVNKGSVEKAYLCLCKMLLMYVEGTNQTLGMLYNATTGDDMSEAVTKEE